jgi:hypothetical protein
MAEDRVEASVGYAAQSIDIVGSPLEPAKFRTTPSPRVRIGSGAANTFPPTSPGRRFELSSGDSRGGHAAARHRPDGGDVSSAPPA